ncbi:hypothetical protein F4813DRAFT_384722 [Daldinia decipiens]|uniref:uncharacterized protein n=1 Tax=Daldinia decipiens TaxID=326647 RepID=UPI0020C4B85A|nr:uncharacterized protein F4813DRAFT_384722 [Daldinia decipiens]KAI1662007.1 hypothetical protein F4813DRAFT_384722 [Daldinia decipiens]
MAVHMAENAAQHSDSVTLYTHGNDEMAAQLSPIANSKFKVEPRQIRRLRENAQANSVIVEFVDGSSKEEKFLVHNPQTSVQGPFVSQLGITLTPMGDIQADAPVIPGAISSGCNAAVAASTQLQAEKYDQPPMF